MNRIKEMKREDIYISFGPFKKEKWILTVKIDNQPCQTFIGKFRLREQILKHIEEEDLSGLINELEYENSAGSQAYYYLLGYLHTKNTPMQKW